MTADILLKDVLNDEEIKKKYNLTDTMIKNARLSGPYEHQIIEYLATMIRASMDQNLSQSTVYNQLKNTLKLA